MAVDDTFEHRMVFRHAQSQNGVLVKCWRITVQSGSRPTMVEIGTAIEQRLLNPLLACISSAWSYQGYKIRGVYPNPTQIVPVGHSAVSGSLIGESLPPQVSSLISLRSTVAPPRVRGRAYLPCATETESGSGVPLASLTNLLATFADLLLSELTVSGTGGTSCIMRCGISPQKARLFFYPFDIRNVRTRFATQRRRSAINRPDVSEF
jgi:hypothetical protein